ncbi:hypothetical protein ERHA54_12100 [Erwinia rhapontici]|nr:hypothetical protein ERHA54_12100 [Erwinia rhapontici]
MNKPDQQRRTFLSHGSKMLGACAILGAGTPLAIAAGSSVFTEQETPMTTVGARHYYLDNVLLETGFHYQEGEVVATRTALHCLEINNGKIVAVRANAVRPDASLTRVDAEGKLLLPAMRDMHIHLDKTFYGGPWRVQSRPAGTTIKQMIALEHRLLPELAPHTQERAGKLIDLLQSKGSSVARSHCNIEPVSGLKNLENLMAVLERRRSGFTCEIVAFPSTGCCCQNLNH